MTTQDLILERFPTLSPKLQAAARFTVDHPNEVVTLSMRALAAHAGAQPATLVRLAQQLGYTGWPDLKDAFVTDLGLRSRGYGLRAKGLTGRASDVGLVAEMFAAHRGNLDATEAHIDASLRDAASLLKGARTVHIAGFRASYPVAYALAYGYRLFRGSVALIDGHAGGFEMQTRSIDATDAVVAISFAPYSSEALQVVDAARACGAKVVVFSDSRASPLALGAHVAVSFAVESPSFFPSIASAVAAVEALLEVLVADAGPETAQHIDRAEQHLFDSGAYLQPPPRRAAVDA